MRKTTWPAVLLALGLVAAACGAPAGTTTTAAGETTTAAGETTTAAGETTTAAAEMKTDIGVDDTTIRVGLLADLTGIFSPLVQDIVTSHEAYWDKRNAEGGIAGRTIELVIEDTNYNVDQHAEKYEALREEVVMLAQSTGSPHTARIKDLLVEDSMAAIALTWYSGWADPNFDGGNVLEKGSNYCLEAMNVVEYLSANFEEESGEKPSWAVVTFPGEYGQDGAAGAKKAIEALGLELAYDGEGQVTPPGDDPETGVIEGILSSGADFVYTVVNPTNLGVLLGGAAQAGFQGQWTGALPSYDFRMLDTPLAPLLTASYWFSSYSVTWGTDVPEMATLIATLTEAAGDRRPSYGFVAGWQEAMLTDTVLTAAADAGDLTRAGVLNAALGLEGIAFNGLAPDQSYAGSPNDHVVRETLIYRPDVSLYTEAGGADQTIATAPNGGTTGEVLVEGAFASELASNYQFDAPCFTAG